MEDEIIVTKDVLGLILLYLSSFDLLKIRCVCKKFKYKCDEILGRRAFHVNSEARIDQLFQFAYRCCIMKAMSISLEAVISENDPSYLSENEDKENDIEFDEVSPFSTHKNIKYQVEILGAFSDYVEIDQCNGYRDDLQANFPCKGNCSDKTCIEGLCPCIQVLPNNLKLSDILYLPYPIKVENRLGANYDLRGLRNPSLEFMDFHRVYVWKKGFISVERFIKDCFRLKSHKFENWYEQIFGICHTDSKTLIPYSYTYERKEYYKEEKFKSYLIALDEISVNKSHHIKRFKSDKIFVAELSGDHGS
jgi:hypothetical protein